MLVMILLRNFIPEAVWKASANESELLSLWNLDKKKKKENMPTSDARDDIQKQAA